MELDKQINLGIIGVSEGNGHPYSWSSIFNGYDEKLMESCPYPGIPRYLEKYNLPSEGIRNAKVSHIWTQEKNLSKQIAETTFIDKIVDEPTDMISEVDGILLARDDYRNHLKLSENFINAGLPIYIDKPLAVNEAMASEILNKQVYEGQIFTGSALAYDPTLIEFAKSLKSESECKFIFGTAPGNWDTYSVHLIDPILRVLNYKFNIHNYNTYSVDSYSSLNGSFNKNCFFSIQCLGGYASPLRLTFIYDDGFKEFDFHIDPFNAFKNALIIFTKNVMTKKVIRTPTEILHSVKLISLGINI